jgi:hypothetical protein
MMSAVDSTSMGFFKLFWGVFTAFMFVGALKHNWITRLVFGSLTLLFITLAIGDFTQITVITQIAGYIGIICGALALYSAVGQVINNEFDKKIFPL